MPVTDENKRLATSFFIAGWGEAEIAERLSLTPDQVRAIITGQLSEMAERRSAIADQAADLYVERLETLLKATWPKAVKGDVRAVETARRLLEQQAEVLDLGNEDTNPYQGPDLHLVQDRGE